MFCFLEKIELETTECPVKCMYRGKDKRCEYRTLTPDSDEAGFDVHVTAKTISEVKGIKLYKVKESVAEAKIRIKTGLTILRYAEFLKTRAKPADLEEQREFIRYRSERNHEPNEHEGLEEILLQEFGLGLEAQQVFFDKKIFQEWADSTEISVSFSAVIDALSYVVSLRQTAQNQENAVNKDKPEARNQHV